MKIGTTKLIAENIAPPNAKSIVVYDGNGNMVCTIPLGRMTPPTKAKLYSFGLVSDIHLYKDGVDWVTWNPNEKFDNALSYFENKGCTFCVVCGDLTQTGFYSRTTETDESTTYLDESQFAKYKEICDKHTIPVYEIMGNHESYYSMPITLNMVVDDGEEKSNLEQYTGKNVLFYTVEQGNDLFILCGQPEQNTVMSDTDYQMLVETLEANKNRRCLVFVHPYIEEDSGDPLDVRENSLFENWGAKKNSFMNLLKQHPNVVLFHGHSHMKFENQEYDVNANYTERNGFKSVHIPSLCVPREINFDTMKSQDDRSASQGYIVDVYDDCIVLIGMDFINETPIPLGVYKITT